MRGKDERSYRTILNLGLTVVLVLQVLEIKEDILITTVLWLIEFEDRRDVCGETKQLCYDGIASADQTEQGLSSHLCYKVLHIDACLYFL